MASFLSSAIIIPSSETINPKSWPSLTAKIFFFGVERYAIPPTSVEYISQVGYMVFSVFGENSNTIQVHHYTISN